MITGTVPLILEDYNFYKNSENWDTMPNLQLLNGTLNESKNDTPLDKWVENVKVKYNYDLENYLVPSDVSLDIRDFKVFITKRKALLKERLMAMVQ